MTACIVCKHEVTNPVCPSCLNEEVIHWLADNQPRLCEKIGGHISSEKMTGESFCVLCSSHVYLCPHCYCNEMTSWFRKDAPQLVQPFKQIFNFGYENRAAQ